MNGDAAACLSILANWSVIEGRADPEALACS